jgi:hypothetical protein
MAAVRAAGEREPKRTGRGNDDEARPKVAVKRTSAVSGKKLKRGRYLPNCEKAEIEEAEIGNAPSSSALATGELGFCFAPNQSSVRHPTDRVVQI